jgi:hypothetical protein
MCGRDADGATVGETIHALSEMLRLGVGVERTEGAGAAIASTLNAGVPVGASAAARPNA